MRDWADDMADKVLQAMAGNSRQAALARVASLLRDIRQEAEEAAFNRLVGAEYKAGGVP